MKSVKEQIWNLILYNVENKVIDKISIRSYNRVENKIQVIDQFYLNLKFQLKEELNEIS